MTTATKEPSPAVTDGKLLIDLAAAAELLSLAPRTVRRMVAEHTIPPDVMFKKAGRRLLFKVTELKQWVARR